MTERQPWVGAKTVLADVDVDTSDLQHPDEETRELLEEIPPGMNYQYFTEKMGHPDPCFGWRSKYSDYLRKAHPHQPVKTVVAQPGHRTGPFHWDGRRFHVTEFARLQTFPVWYGFPEATTTARELVGNAVPPSLSESLAEAIGGECDVIDDGEELPSPHRGRTAHQTYRRRTEHRLKKLYGEDVVNDD